MKKSEIHGMSQRGGSVASDVRFGVRVNSPMITRGEADCLMVVEPDQVEVNRPVLKPGGVLVTPDDLANAGKIQAKSINVALLGVLIFQAVSGLVSNDDIAFTGPLYALVSKDTSDWLSSLHRQNFWVIIVLVSLHVLAILFYVHVKKDNLVKPMITGVKEVSDPEARTAQGGGAVALVLALVVAGFTVWVATGGLLPPPPPPLPAQAAPAW